MGLRLWMYNNKYQLEKTVDVDRPWRDTIRTQIFCRNQEEHDYLCGLNLMHGREIEINIWDEWTKSTCAYMTMTDEGIKIHKGKPHVLPFAYATWPVDMGDY